MNFKKHMKRFFTLSRSADGFTLVELIVVIAILAILGGVAVPAYSGYIKKTNQTADMTLASDVANALQLYYYNTLGTESGFNGATSVVLTKTGVDLTKTDDFAQAAMQNAFGAGWETKLALKYNKWGNGAKMASDVLSFIKNNTDSNLTGIFNGTQKPGYVDDIDNLYTEVEETAKWVGGKLNTTGAALVGGAASLTTGGKSSSDFANTWVTLGAEFADFFNATEYGPGASNASSTELINLNVACAGAVKARNLSIASYVRTQMTALSSTTGWTPEQINTVYTNLSNFTMSGSSVPADLGALFVTPSAGDFVDLQKKMKDETGDEAVAGAAIEFANAYFSSDNAAAAKNDALGYFGMMATMDAVGGDTSNDESYWEDASSALDVYKAALNGVDLSKVQASLGSVAEDCVSVVMYVVNGELTMVVAPNGVKAN